MQFDRLHFLQVLSRMGVVTGTSVVGQQLGEPVGSIHVASTAGLRPTTVRADELPLVIDEVPVLAMLGAHARGETRFLGASELRVKESDRLTALVQGIRALGGHAAAEADDLVVEGGGLRGGVASSGGVGAGRAEPVISSRPGPMARSSTTTSCCGR